MFLAAPAVNFRKRDIIGDSEKAFLGFFGNFFVANVHPKKKVF